MHRRAEALRFRAKAAVLGMFRGWKDPLILLSTLRACRGGNGCRARLSRLEDGRAVGFDSSAECAACSEDKKLTVYFKHPGSCDEQRRVLEKVLPAGRPDSN